MTNSDFSQPGRYSLVRSQNFQPHAVVMKSPITLECQRRPNGEPGLYPALQKEGGNLTSAGVVSKEAN